jgi:feruloyl esterase
MAIRSTVPAALLVAVAAALAGVSAPPVHAQAFADAKTGLVDYSKAELVPRNSCESLGSYTGKDVVSVQAEAIAESGAVPAHCRISGTLAPEIAFEVSLPARWNGRFYMIGNGGLAGESLQDPFRTAQRSGALQAGFAFAQTNTGHDARKEPGGKFVLSNPQKAVDYAYRAVHLTAITAKAIAARYYARPVTRSYWNSCSNGGRQGLIEAQRYPEDFDGLIVNAPWVDQTGYTLGQLWNQQAVSEAKLTAGKLALLSAKVMDKCDAIDGVKDGLIDDPRKCAFDARRDVPACPAGTDTDACLTAPQAGAIMKVYSGPRGGGRALFPGYMPGSEAVVPAAFGSAPASSAWMSFIVAAQPDRNPADFDLAENIMRYLVFSPPRPDYDYRTFDFDRDAHLLDRWGKQVNALEVLHAARVVDHKVVRTRPLCPYPQVARYAGQGSLDEAANFHCEIP